MYYYAAYAIAKGVTPYTQIMLPHPPIGYLFLIPAVILAQGNLLILRTFDLCTFLLDAAISYWLFRLLRQQSSASFHSLLAFALFTLYPLPFTTTTPLEFTVFDIPILLGTVFFVKGITMKSVSRLVFSGVLLGIAVMIWFTAAFFAASLIGFLAIYGPKTDTGRLFRRFAKQSAAILTGGGFAIALVLLLIIGWGGLSNFLVQSVGLQTSLRAGFTFGERLHHILLAVHYVAYLMPFLVFMAAGPLERFAHVIHRMPKRLAKPVPWDIFQSALAIGLIASGVIIFPYQAGFLVNNPYTVANQTVGQYVANITLPGSAIWTSEGSVAYFASRLIQPPNSTQWPFQAEYNDIFNTTYIDSDGITQRGLEAVSPSQFVNSWQSHNTMVLVFILGNGPVPYPDELLWYGFSGTAGVSQWVGLNYDLLRTFTFPNVSYQYFVWVKK